MAEAKKQKEASFRGLYIIVALIICAILAAGIFGKIAQHGVKRQGERCASNEECDENFVCYSYQGAPPSCLQNCYKQACSPGFECASIGEQRGRRSLRVRNLCVSHIIAQ